ncbi:WD repeat-containing protein 81 isoform X2 [Diorhabda carinulata]|uniref:WD repeat-containing protein 81 isoform X2 n=1 Tax=Diorhabda carinulata TaxID=1163345 RepID=UPI0025A24DCD|nr:WD repeat-containing protein 81 isoform X2 [Diorhabda carinulata]
MFDAFEEIGIPKKYIKKTNKEDRFVAFVSKLWLKNLIKHLKLTEFIEKPNFQAWPTAEEELGPSWVKVLISYVLKRDCKIFPLPKIRSSQDENPLLFSLLMEYVSQTNFINLWKKAYKKYVSKNSNRETKIVLTEYNIVLREIVTRIYGCPIINTYEESLNVSQSAQFHVHLNIFPALCAVETPKAMFIFHLPYIEHNINDCVTFSPAILDKSHTKSLFIVYQLLNVLKTLHERSLTLGDITLNDIFVSEDMWIYIFPQITSNLHCDENLYKASETNTANKLNSIRNINGNKNYSFYSSHIYDVVQVKDESLNDLCQLWINGLISNFTYISALNKLSGRVLGDPNCHYVFPWVTDFTSACGRNWRDLKKSKFRLNKGDHQLDLTFDTSQSQVPHHVSDVLSPITYYVYMARKTLKSVLCKNVRTIWVPAEYPSSIQRIQEWTPDECIPEFYTDPSIFRSIHEDLDDLSVPAWASDPEEFIENHRKALESPNVSEKLHYWIDLTFGYKLSGNPAIRSRNVCLNLADEHENLTKSGLVQLFSHPHPPRATDSQYFAKIPPRVLVNQYCRHRSRVRNNSAISTHESNTSDDERLTNENSNNMLFCGRSSLNEDVTNKAIRSSSTHRSELLSIINRPIETPINTLVLSETINLPKDYKPEFLLEAFEKKHNFLSKTFYQNYNGNIQDIKTDRHYSLLTDDEIYRQKLKCRQSNQIINQNDFIVTCNYVDIITSRRINELKVLGCLILEIFMAKQLRPVGSINSSTTLENRLKCCLSILNSCDIPPCISYIVNLLLQPEKEEYTGVTDMGLPPPSAYLLLEPLMHMTIPFSKHFPYLYELLQNLKEFKNVSVELSILYHFDCDGQMCSEYENLEKTKILFAQNIAECKVKMCAKQLDILLDDINYTDNEIVYIILPHIKELIEDPPTSVLAAWYLFEPISRVLGPQKTAKYLLDPILKLYENECVDTHLPYIKKIAKLYHHSFLLCLMVRLGLKKFLENFVVPLVEAVGGYKDYDLVDFVLHNHSEKIAKRNSHLKIIESDQMDVNKSDNGDPTNQQSSKHLQGKDYIVREEVFEIEEEKNNEDQMKFLLEHLQLNVSSELPFNHSTAEEAMETLIHTNAELVLHSEDEISDSSDTMKSPTIPIPQTLYSNVTNITCEVGSKKSETEFSEQSVTPNFPKTEFQRSKSSTKISEMSADSLVWLSHRLGPLLSAKYLSRNLLKMLTLCYIGKDNISSYVPDGLYNFKDISITSHFIKGDQATIKILECLTNISALYGEQIIIFQYIPYMTELITLSKKRITPNLEGGLISCLTLLKSIIPYLTDGTLMNQLQDVILTCILHPIIRLLNSTNHVFPSGSTARNTLARKYLDVIYILSIRIGVDMTKKYLLVPALQRFFLIFDKVYTNSDESEKACHLESIGQSNTEEETINVLQRRASELTETPQASEETVEKRALLEIIDVFTKELAHTAYLPFVKLLGLNCLETALNNYDKICKLCQEYEDEIKNSNVKTVSTLKLSDFNVFTPLVTSSSIGSNIALVGNRIDIQSENVDSINMDLLSLVSNRIENSSRHLRGNWLAYWEYEIGRSEKDVQLNFKQIKLQTFVGHTQSVKCLHVLDNENSFMSGSRDKTVKLWSLRSQGDGFATSTCQWTYSSHKKSILSITFLESLRLVASCDSIVHIWDPFMGANVGNLESPKFAPVNTLKSMPAPSTLVFAATTDGTVKVLDTRVLNYIYELKMSPNLSSLIRCLAIAPSGNWVAAGQSSGFITILDTRTGLIIANWRAHESEVLQLEVHNEDSLVSSSLDQSTSVWNASDGKLKFHMRGTTEPVHCLSIHNNELISGTTGNRIGVHSSITCDASFSNNKLRGDSFKGLLTSMDYLPLNRLLLLGADTGNINLLC